MWNIVFALSLILALLFFLWTSSLQPYVSSVSESCIIHSVISGFRSEVDENSVLLGCYATSSVNYLPTFRNDLTVPFSRVKNPKKVGTDRLSRNVGKELPPLASK